MNDESKFTSELQQPPYNIEAEEALLGSIFIKPSIMSEIIEIIKEKDFYKNSYKIIFNEMFNLYDTEGKIDIVLIIDNLKKKNLLDVIGGEEVLYNLIEIVPTAANAINYAKIIKEKSVRRDLINAGEKITQMAYRGYDEIEKILDISESMIFEIAESKEKKDIVSLRELANVKVKNLDKNSEYKSGLRGISSGFRDYDSLTSGFHGSDLIILAARPAMGKTAFALNLALNVAKSGKHVLLYSLEMGNEQLFDRLLAIESKVQLKAIRDGNLKGQELTAVGDGMGRLAEMPIYISDSSSVNILEIKAVARRLKSEGKLDFMLIDYLQLINPSEGSRKSREQEISEISRSLKIIAKELDIPVITLSQLSRSVEQRQDKRPILSDLRESGAIEQDADMVMFLYREKYYMKDEATQVENVNIPKEYISDPVKMAQNSNPENSEVEKVEVIIGKHRSGPTGTIELAFKPNYQLFVDIVSNNVMNRYNQ